MGNTYRATGERAKALYGEGVLKLDLSAADERDALEGKQLELLPRAYRVLSDNFATASQGATFEAAYPVEIESALIAGGHIVRVTEEDTEPSSTELTSEQARANEGLPPLPNDDTKTPDDTDVPPTEDGATPDPDKKGK